MALTRKQGVVFTLMAIVISSVIIVSFMTANQKVVTEQQPELLRVKVVNSIADSFFSYAETALRTSTHAGLSNLSMILAAQPDPEMNTYYADEDTVKTNLRYCILNTGDNIRQDQPSGATWHTGPCSPAHSFPVLLNNFTALVNDSFGVEITYAYDAASFTVEQIVPFEVLANITLFVNVTDDFANWTLEENLSVRIPLTGVREPVTAKFDANDSYTWSSFSAYTIQENKQRPTIGSASLFNASTFLEMMQQKEYRKALGRAPSLLQRYYGDFSPSACCGIEAFIDGNQLKGGAWPQSFAGAQSNYSFTDHELLGNTNYPFSPKTYFCDVTGGVAQTHAIVTSSGDTTNFFWMNASTLNVYGFRLENVTSC